MVGVLTLCSCSESKDKSKASNEGASATPAAARQEGQALREPGGSETETITAVYSVESVDSATRIVTLKSESGELSNVKCGPEVVNFDQIRAGDQVRVMLTRSVAVFLRKADGASVETSSAVTHAPKGSATPGGTVSETVEVTAKVNAIDTANRIVTLTGPRGNTFTIKVDPGVDLSKVSISDVVVVRYTQAMAIRLEKTGSR